jgi:hypothetical protein
MSSNPESFLRSARRAARLLAPVFLVLFLAACSTYKEGSSADSRRLILDKPVTIKFPLQNVTIPAGTYTPEGSDDEGTFYKAPTDVILGQHMVPGGIFVPGKPGVREYVYYDARMYDMGRRTPALPDEPLHYTLEP